MGLHWIKLEFRAVGFYPKSSNMRWNRMIATGLATNTYRYCRGHGMLVQYKVKQSPCGCVFQLGIPDLNAALSRVRGVGKLYKYSDLGLFRSRREAGDV